MSHDRPFSRQSVGVIANCRGHIRSIRPTAFSLRVNGPEPLAVSAAGVAIFVSGLVLAAHRIKLTSPTVIIGSLISLLVHPALFFIIIRVAGVSGAMADADFIASTMPTSTLSFALQYAACEAETASIMVVTTFGMLGCAAGQHRAQHLPLKQSGTHCTDSSDRLDSGMLARR